MNDWSLKGKEEYVDADDLMDETQAEYVKEEAGDMNVEVEIIKVYEAKFIETLRQKLIEDMKEYLVYVANCEVFADVKKIINRRFGVDVNAEGKK